MDVSHSTTLGLSFAESVTRVRACLAEEGFGILTEIDVQSTLRDKLGVETEPYVILGACNPALAHRALQTDPRVGVLLPCNVTVSTQGDRALVQVMNPEVMTAFDDTDALGPVVADASARLTRVLHALTE